jgi:hypothetical protein
LAFTATYTRQIISQAAQTEGLTAAQAKAVLAALPDGWLSSLRAFADDPANDGSSLANWRAAFPTILNTADAAKDSFLVRVAVAAAGGVVV